MKKYIITSAIVVVFLAIYGFLILGLPRLLTCSKSIEIYKSSLKEKTGLYFDIKNLNVKIKPNLKFIITVDSISTTGANVSKLSYNASIFNLKHGNLGSKSIIIDYPLLKKHLKTSKKQDKPFRVDFFPKTNIENAFIKINDDADIRIDYIKSIKKHHSIFTKMYGTFITKNLSSPIVIGENGAVVYRKGFSFDNFSLRIGNSTLCLSGEKDNLYIKAQDLPASDLSKEFLYFYKLKHPKKKNFLENFYDLTGFLDIDLVYSKGNFSGKCIAKDLRALFFDYKIPVYLPETVFNFSNKDVKAQTVGKFGPNPVKVVFNLSGIATKNVLVTGTVQSSLTNALTKKYYPNVGITKSADALVKYHTLNGKVDIDYILTLNKGSDLTFKYGELGHTDKERKIFAHTQKTGDVINLTDLYYEFVGNKKLITGNGRFEKINAKFAPVKLSIKTNGNITTAVLSPLIGDYITKGFFNADLAYDFISKTLDGTMKFYNIAHNDYLYLKETELNVDKDCIKLNTFGSFFGSPVVASAKVKNKFGNDIIVHNIDVSLKEFFVQRGKYSTLPKIDKGKTHAQRRYNFVVENGHAFVDRIYGRKFDVRNVDIFGKLSNNVARFVIPQAQYAEGLLSAKGIYDMNDYSSNIEFFASDINSNDVITNFFKLPNQVEGSAFAILHLITKNKLNDIKAEATFAIADGYLPKIGSREFIIDASKSKKQSHSKLVNKLKSKINFKISLDKIISNFDKNKSTVIGYTNIYGTFKLDNEDVKDVKIFTKSDIISMFVEGDYNIDTEVGNLAIWGRRNKTAAKKIRVFKIPFNWIYNVVFRTEHTINQYVHKINLIPEIKAAIGDDIATFRIYVEGNLNESKKMKVELKDLR